MPAETPFLSDYPVTSIMDFSGNNRNINMNMNMNINDHNNDFSSMNDQELLRRLAASRAGMSMGQDNGTFGFSSRLHGSAGMNNNQSGPGNGAMFGQSMPQNQFQMNPSPNPTRSSGTNSGNGQPDREEELLLQLLLARRRRQELQNEFTPGSADQTTTDNRNHPNNFSDELMRLRQAGNAAAASSVATAAMFAAEQDQQQQLLHLQQQQQQQQQFLQQQQQQRQQRANVATGGQGLFSQPSLNMPAAPAFGMMQDQMNMNNTAPTLRNPGMNMNMNTMNMNMNTMNMNNNNNGSFGARRTFDDFLLHNQQPHPQDSVLAGMAVDQQRIELSPSRFRSLQQQEGPTFLDLGLPGPNKRSLMGVPQDFKHFRDFSKIVELEPPAKKKRLHKKKPSDMPRRPLSAYNLFFSEERERILKEIGGGDGMNDKASEKDESKAEGDGSKKPRALLRPLLPSEKKRRPHRKTHGKISFRLLAQMVGQRWKALPSERRKYYQELAKEDMARQKKAMEEYYQKQSEKVNKDSKQEGDNEEEEESADTQPADAMKPPSGKQMLAGAGGLE